MRNKKRGKWIKWVEYAVLISVLGAVIYAVRRSGFFEIRTISCRVDEGRECSAEIITELNQYIGKNLLFIRKDEIEDRIISADRLAAGASAKFRLPNSLIVSIVSRRPAAAITLSENFSEAVTVDSEGVILGKTDESAGLPRLVWPGISTWPIEKRLPENIVRGLTLTSLAGEKFQLEGIVSIDSGSPYRSTGQASTEMAVSSVPVAAMMRLKSGEKVWLGLDKEPVEQLTRLQLVLNQVRIENKQVSEIDLRFDNPVIR